ncbi:MAG: DNA polymerase I [Candidatus Ryanbacteria bacterium]|nr:DNA polymerase I [Candidatus Ryanbacteria bacterium]
MARELKKLVILDAHALIHRSFHALPSFASPSGEPLGAVYGVSAVLLKLIRDLRPTHIVAAFDREEPTFRHIVYENYKATRSETKSDLIPQFDKVKEVFRAFGIPILEAPGFEADDILGTLVEKFKKEKDLTIIIASGDMDTMQLIDDKRVMVYTLRKGIEDTILYDEEKVLERFGFGPTLIADYKGLKGDPSDNIIGIKGIGEKSATDLIKHYGSIEEMYIKLKKEKKSPAFLKDRIKKLLIEGEEDALFSKELATIRRDAPVEADLGSMAFASIPIEEVSKIFRKFHFPSLISRLQDAGAPPKKEEEKPIVVHKELDDSVEAGARAALFFGEDGLILGVDANTYSVPQAQRAVLLALLGDSKEVIVHDAHALMTFLGASFPVSFDTKLGAWILNPDERGLSLGDLLEGKPLTIAEVVRLADTLKKKIEKEDLAPIYFDFELPLVAILFEMEEAGITLDTAVLAKLSKEAEHEEHVLEADIWKAAGEEFDINSPKQLSVILFEKLGLSTKGIRKTSTKAVSTQFSELIKLRELHPIIDMLIRYREISKLLSTYITALPKLIGSDGRVHTTFNETGAATGRLSSSNPNLQNIPIKSELGRSIRRAFVAPKGYELLAFDYSQLELRIAAQLSGDKKLTHAFQTSEDIHTRTASEIFHVATGEVTSEMRRRAKTVNFGILYGMGARSLAETGHMTVAEAEAALDNYLQEFPGIEEYRERTIHEGREKGYVKTFFGRKRFLPNLRSSFEYIRKESERMAVNAPVQGTAADIVKRAMIDIAHELKLSRDNHDVRMLLQVHDELVFEIKKEKIAETVSTIKAIMERVPEFSVPIIAEVKRGANWQEMTSMVF